MKVVQINAVCGVGSTGGITVEISKMLTEHNIENYIFYTGEKYDYKYGIKYSCMPYIKFNAFWTRLFGNYGFNSHISTAVLINKLEKINPDIVHIHNIHGHDLNFEMFCQYLSKKKIKVVWTFHDCWTFTGYCTHFDAAKCSRWKDKCGECIQKKKYSWFFDRSAEMLARKKRLISMLEDIVIVSPSQWIADMAKQSFLKSCHIEVIYNGIDLEVFKPCESEFRKKYGIRADEYMILGIPKIYYSRFLDFGKYVKKPYKLVLTGLNEKQLASLPEGIIGLPKLPRNKMAEVFTAADVYINLTAEDTFPTVNLESLACGTPVITYNTGGSPEALDIKTGITVKKYDNKEAYSAVKKICTGQYLSSDCRKRAELLYDKNRQFEKYMDIYTNLIKES